MMSNFSGFEQADSACKSAERIRKKCDTTNKATFAKVEKSFGKLDLEVGTRYDYTDVDSSDITKLDKKYIDITNQVKQELNLA